MPEADSGEQGMTQDLSVNSREMDDGADEQVHLTAANTSFH